MLISTISPAAYTILTIVFTAIAIGLIVLFYFVTRHERKRFKESRILDKDAKVVKFEDELKKRVARARSTTKFTMLCYFVDDITGIANKHGNAGVSGMYEVLYKRIRRSLHLPVSICSYGKDKVVVIADKAVKPSVWNKLMPKSIASIREPIIMADSKGIVLDVNIAIVGYPADGDEISKLTSSLEVALAISKRRGQNNFVVFNKSFIDDEAINYSAYLDFQKAIATRNLNVYYRKIMSVADRVGYGIKANLMLRSEEEHSQADYQSLMESTGDINWLGLYAFRKAVAQLAQLNRGDTKQVLVYKFTNTQLRDKGLLAKIVKIAGFYEVDTSNIVIEAEYIAINELGDAKFEIMKSYKESGVKIMVADITISTTTAELTELGVNYVKLDSRLLIDGCRENKDSIIRYLDSLNSDNMMTIVYGVDTLDAYNQITPLGVDYCCGDYVSPYLTQKEIA